MSGSPVMVLEYRLRPTWRAIFGVALPSSSMNVAPPLLTTGQSALLGHSGGAIALASYGSVSTAISLAARVSSFLCDASSAKVGTAIGERNWAKLADAIQTGIAYAMALGLATVMILSALGPVVFARVLRLEGAVLAAAGEYFKLALIKVPFTLVGLVINGALQGIRQNNVLAGTTAFFSVLEFVLDWTAVQLPDICPGRSLLWKFGVIGIIIAALQVTATGGMLLKLKPVEADEGFSLYRELRERLVIPDAEPTDGSQVEDGNEVVEEQGSGLVLRSGMTDMLIRSLVMQGTFAWALLCASRLSDSTTALAAHHIITNMWMVISYFVDGFSAVRLNPDFCAAPSLPLRRSLRCPFAATFAAPPPAPCRSFPISLEPRQASIVLGTRMRAQSDTEALSTLTVRCLAAGLVAGLVMMVALLLGEERVLAFYIGQSNEGSEATRQLLRTAWILVATVQPLNGLVFVIDGILCGGGDFRYISKAYVAGFIFVFLPLIVSPLRMSLLGIWGVKGFFNLYRCVAAFHWVRTDWKRIQEH